MSVRSELERLEELGSRCRMPDRGDRFATPAGSALLDDLGDLDPIQRARARARLANIGVRRPANLTAEDLPIAALIVTEESAR